MSAQAVAALYYLAGEHYVTASRAFAAGRWADGGYHEDEARAVRSAAARMWKALLIQHTHDGRPWSRDEDVQKALDEAHRAGYRDGWDAREAATLVKRRPRRKREVGAAMGRDSEGRKA